MHGPLSSERHLRARTAYRRMAGDPVISWLRLWGWPCPGAWPAPCIWQPALWGLLLTVRVCLSGCCSQHTAMGQYGTRPTVMKVSKVHND